MTVYVWSGASGSNDGTSWTDAYGTFQEGLDNTSPTSEVMYVHTGASSPHSETSASSVEFTSSQLDLISNPILVYGVDKDNSDAAVNRPSSTNWKVTGSATYDFSANTLIHGMKFDAQADYFINDSTTYYGFVGCAVHSETSGDDLNVGSSESYIFFEDCEIDVATIRGITGRVSFYGCSLNVRSSPNFKSFVSNGASLLVQGCDLSTITAGSTIVEVSNNVRDVKFINCDMPTTWTGVSSTFGNNGAKVSFENCDDSNDYSRTEVYSYGGSVKTDTGVYITTDGWSDKTANATGVPLSHKVTPNIAMRSANDLKSIPLVSYIDSTGSKTFTVELLDDFATTLQDDEVWLDVYYHGASGQVGHSLASSRLILGDTPSNLSAGTGTSNWTGVPTSARSVKIEVNATVNNIGFYESVVRLAKYEANGADGNPGAALYVAPLVTIS